VALLSNNFTPTRVRCGPDFTLRGKRVETSQHFQGTIKNFFKDVSGPSFSPSTASDTFGYQHKNVPLKGPRILRISFITTHVIQISVSEWKHVDFTLTPIL
jgi:hypothetical protein